MTVAGQEIFDLVSMGLVPGDGFSIAR